MFCYQLPQILTLLGFHSFGLLAIMVFQPCLAQFLGLQLLWASAVLASCCLALGFQLFWTVSQVKLQPCLAFSHVYSSHIRLMALLGFRPCLASSHFGASNYVWFQPYLAFTLAWLQPQLVFSHFRLLTMFGFQLDQPFGYVWLRSQCGVSLSFQAISHFQPKPILAYNCLDFLPI